MKAKGTGGVWEVVLMPHAPVLIPEVGGGREREAIATVEAMGEAARMVVASQPEAVLVISPHSPRQPGHFGFWSGATLAGDMSRFGCPEVTLEVPNAAALATAIGERFHETGLATWWVPAQPLDHGAFVPLYFLTRSGWTGPTVVMGLNHPGEGGWRKAGQGIQRAAQMLGTRLAVVASGDMSHRLRPGAPAGYEPQAAKFDQEFVRILCAGRFEALSQLDPTLQELAAEDVVDSTLIAAHAAGLAATDHRVLSYEGPFGVGYCVARLFQAEAKGSVGGLLPAIAREAVEWHLHNGRPHRALPPDEFFDQRAGVFVTIRTREGRLRGCRGTIFPQRPNLIEETRAVAVSSAFQDGRFEPVTEDELDQLTYEVSVLHPPEPVASAAELDPHRYGVIVSTPDGRRGLMLPGVEGLDTVAEQIDATCRKAQIDPREPLMLERFTTEQFTEE
jgi:MEMO1 family protein